MHAKQLGEKRTQTLLQPSDDSDLEQKTQKAIKELMEETKNEIRTVQRGLEKSFA